jgi:hypothetical protein
MTESATLELWLSMSKCESLVACSVPATVGILAAGPGGLMGDSLIQGESVQVIPSVTTEFI